MGTGLWVEEKKKDRSTNRRKGTQAQVASPLRHTNSFALRYVGIRKGRELC